MYEWDGYMSRFTEFKVVEHGRSEGHIPIMLTMSWVSLYLDPCLNKVVTYDISDRVGWGDTTRYRI